MKPAPGYFVSTERVGLRKFRAEDLDDFYELNSDPVVMEFLPSCLSREECRTYIDRINSKIDEQGFGFWAAERFSDGACMGFVGITRVSFEAEFTPNVEIGWRLARPYWGQGFATEAATGALDYGFEQLQLPEIVSFTVPANERSYKVMERLGMKRQGFFEHPKLKPGHRLRTHVWYRKTAAEHLDGK